MAATRRRRSSPSRSFFNTGFTRAIDGSSLRQTHKNIFQVGRHFVEVADLHAVFRQKRQSLGELLLVGLHLVTQRGTRARPRPAVAPGSFDRLPLPRSFTQEL